MRYLLSACVLVLSVVSTSAQAALDGPWTFTMTSPMGSVDAKVELKADGDALKGTFEVNGASWPIEQGSIKGDRIAFVLQRPGASMTYEMQGTVKADAIAGQAQAMGATVDWTMTKAR